MRAIVALSIMAACAPEQAPLGGRRAEVSAFDTFQASVGRNGAVVTIDGIRISLLTPEPGGWSQECNSSNGCEQGLVIGRDGATYGNVFGSVPELVRRDPSSGEIQWRKVGPDAGRGRIVADRGIDDVWWFMTSYQGMTPTSQWAHYDAAGTRLAGGMLGFSLDDLLVLACPDGTFLGREVSTSGLVRFDRNGGVLDRLERFVFDAVVHDDGEITLVQGTHMGTPQAGISLVRLDATGEQRWEHSLTSTGQLVALPDGSVIMTGVASLGGPRNGNDAGRSYFQHFDRDGHREIEIVDAVLRLVPGATFDGYAFYALTFDHEAIDLHTHELPAGSWLVWRTPP